MLAYLSMLALLTTVVLALLRALHRPWWDRRWVSRGVVLLFLVGAAGIVTRHLGLGKVVAGFESPRLTFTGGLLGGLGVIGVLGLLLSLPAAGAVRAVLSRTLRPGPAPRPRPDADAALPRVDIAATPPVSRRMLLEVGAASLPVTALGFGAVGVASALEETQVVERRIAFPGLPEDLRGLRVLQFTDVHLGAFMDPAGFAALVERGRAARPDIVVLTGDFCDHLPWLDGALRAVQSLDPRLGSFAVMGNHEYYRGALATRRGYAKTHIELLDDAHRVLRVGDSTLVVSGVDDPVGKGRANDHYPGAADRALSGAPSGAFHLGLCHRPSGFPTLAARGIDLTLSGHTHGAQLGSGDRSLLEPAFPEAYLRGSYDLAGKKLYTSSGAGHWLAFRLDCPSEAALIVLERA